MTDKEKEALCGLLGCALAPVAFVVGLGVYGFLFLAGLKLAIFLSERFLP